MAEIPRNRSVPSGHDDEFENPVDEDFHCTICQLATDFVGNVSKSIYEGMIS